MPHTATDFGALVQSLPGNILLLLPDSPHFTIVAVSNEYAKLLHITHRQLVGKPLAELLRLLSAPEGDDQVHMLRSSVDRVMKMGQADEIPFCTLDIPSSSRPGVLRYCSVKNIPVHRHDGELDYIIHSLKDITETASLKKKNESGEARLRNLIMDAPQPMALLSGAQLQLEIASDSMLKIWGKDQTVLGKPLFETLPELGAQKPYRQVIEEVYQNGVPYQAMEALIHIKRNGHFKPHYFNICCTALREADQTISGIIVTATDVTEQVMIRQQMQQSEMRFRNMIVNAPVAIAVVKGPEMNLESANSAMLDIWGKTASIIGMPLLQALPEVVDQPFPELLNQVYLTGREYHGFEMLAYLLIRGILEERYFNFIYAPVREEGNRITGVMMIANDVTAQVKAKMELQDSEKRFRDLVAKAPVATAIYVGEDMTIQLANEAMLTLWGKDKSVINKPLQEALPELAGQPFFDLLRRVYTTGVTYRATEDKADLVVDGKLQSYYFNFTYKPLKKANGEIYGILNMAIDVTEQVMSRRKILEGEEQLRVAVEATELGTFSINLKTNDLEYSSRAAEIFTGDKNMKVSREELIKLVHPEDRMAREKAYEKAYREGLLDYEIRMIWPDKTVHWMKVRGRLILDGPTPYRLYGTVLDITQSKQVEEALEERVRQRTRELQQTNRDLEQSNRELEQYAYVASHDLQEPLRKIITYGSMLREKSAEMLDAPSRNRLNKIMSSAARMSSLINDLLNFSRLLKEERSFGKTDLNQILDNVINDFELTIEEKNAIIYKEALPVIEGSPQQMNQLFYNLISNALKFSKTNEQPVITIKCRLLGKEELPQLTDPENGYSYCDITVSDNGIGFSSAHREQIFEIFKRLHTREIYPGSGIGLALCRKIAQNHQGDIFAESIEGTGSIFHVLLPVRQRPFVEAS